MRLIFHGFGCVSPSALPRFGSCRLDAARYFSRSFDEGGGMEPSSVTRNERAFPKLERYGPWKHWLFPRSVLRPSDRPTDRPSFVPSHSARPWFPQSVHFSLTYKT